MRRIVHVLGSLHVGGGERVALLLCQHQVRAGHDVLVLSLEQPPNGPLRSEFEAAGVRVVLVPKGPGFDATLSARIAAKLWQLRPDIVHTHNPPPQIYAIGPARLVGARVIHTKHGPHPDAFHRLMMRRAGALLAHRFVAVSQMTADFALELRECPPRRLRIVPNGTDVERFRSDPLARLRVRAGLGIPEQAVVFGTVGRLAKVKNHPRLLRACAPLLGETTRLAIAGGGPEEAATRALASELGIAPWVHFAGETRDIPGFLSALDVFALSSDTEGLPLSITEAMAVGLPVVATAVGGVPLVVRLAETGFVVPKEDEAAFRGHLDALAKDAPLRERLGRNARQVAERAYSSERMAREYDALYGGDA